VIQQIGEQITSGISGGMRKLREPGPEKLIGAKGNLV
jgi:hypothetical protein